MAEKYELRPMYSKTLIVTCAMPTYWEIVQSNVKENGGIVYGSLILKCIANVQSNEGIVNLGVTFPAYSFTPAMVSNGLWDYVPTRMVRAYINAGGYITMNTAFTAGEYVTITILNGNAF